MVNAPLEQVPLFVRRGAIIPMAKQKDFTLQSPDDSLTIEIWPHEESEYILYEDDGVSLNYLSGSYSTTGISVSAKNGNITIRKESSDGRFTGEPQHRFYSFKINNILTKPDSVTLDGMIYPESSSGWQHENEILYVSQELKPKETAIFKIWNTSIGEGTVKNLPEESSSPYSYFSSTIFPFEISKGSEANLFIYNTNGLLLSTLRSAWTSAGEYSLFWDGRDEFGNSLQNCVYIYKFAILGKSLTKKLLLAQ